MRITFFCVLLVLASCENTDENSKERKNNSVVVKDATVNDTVPDEDVANNLLEYKEGNYQTDVLLVVKKYEKIVKELGFNIVPSNKLKGYKREEFFNDSFIDVRYEKQFDKGKNQMVTLLLYEYQNAESSIATFNEIMNHKYRDGILKSGAYLIHHSKYLIQVIGTCSIDKNSWKALGNELNIKYPHLSCLCGGWCEEKI